MYELINTLNELVAHTSSVEKLVAQLKEDASAYSDEAAHARKMGQRVTPFGGSDAQKIADALVLRLKSASQQIQFTGTELVRFAP